jgi:phage replication initiation protein
MDSGFTLTIDWLAFTVLASNPQETMRVLGGDWSKAKGGFRGYPLSWMRTDGLRGVGKLGTNAPRRPNEIHVDLSGGLASALTLDQIRTLLKWMHRCQGSPNSPQFGSSKIPRLGYVAVDASSTRTSPALSFSFSR